jgi:hypothetical protein
MADLNVAVFAPGAHLDGWRPAAQEAVHRLGDIWVEREAVTVVNLDQHIERRRRLAFEHGLLRAAPSRFVITKSDRLDPADQIGEGGILDQVFQGAAVGGRNQAHTPLGDAARGVRLGLGADLIDHDDLGHVVLHCFDHHPVLQIWRRYLHAPGAADRRVGNVAVAGDFI